MKNVGRILTGKPFLLPLAHHGRWPPSPNISIVIGVLGLVLLSDSAQNQIGFESKTVAEVDRVYNNSLKIGVPALMISGPPKTGTRTLINSID